jgi:hypothetical protein
LLAPRIPFVASFRGGRHNLAPERRAEVAQPPRGCNPSFRGHGTARCQRLIVSSARRLSTASLPKFASRLGAVHIERRCPTVDLCVANVFTADFGGLWRTITAGQRVVHTPANGSERRRPRDIRGMRGDDPAAAARRLMARSSPDSAPGRRARLVGQLHPSDVELVVECSISRSR